MLLTKGITLSVGTTHGGTAALRCVEDGGLVATMVNDGWDVHNAEEMARRYNAFPDLLAALTDLVHAFHRDTRGDDVPPKYRHAYTAARAAIAKAEGGAR